MLVVLASAPLLLALVHHQPRVDDAVALELVEELVGHVLARAHREGAIRLGRARDRVRRVDELVLRDLVEAGLRRPVHAHALRHHLDDLVGQALAAPHARVELNRLPRALVLEVAVLLRHPPRVDVVHRGAAPRPVELHRGRRRAPPPGEEDRQLSRRARRPQRALVPPRRLAAAEVPERGEARRPRPLQHRLALSAGARRQHHRHARAPRRRQRLHRRRQRCAGLCRPHMDVGVTPRQARHGRLDARRRSEGRQPVRRTLAERRLVEASRMGVVDLAKALLAERPPPVAPTRRRARRCALLKRGRLLGAARVDHRLDRRACSPRRLARHGLEAQPRAGARLARATQPRREHAPRPARPRHHLVVRDARHAEATMRLLHRRLAEEELGVRWGNGLREACPPHVPGVDAHRRRVRRQRAACGPRALDRKQVPRAARLAYRTPIRVDAQPPPPLAEARARPQRLARAKGSVEVNSEVSLEAPPAIDSQTEVAAAQHQRL